MSVRMTDYERLIEAYKVDVRHPDVSGMEHLDMLLTRSEIAWGEHCLTAGQRRCLEAADQILVRQAR